MKIIKIVADKLKGHVLYSQEKIKDPVVYAKLFDICGSASWYITEYDSQTKTAFGYVEGLGVYPSDDEWGYVNIEDLAGIRRAGIPRIEFDLHFGFKKFSEIKIRGK